MSNGLFISEIEENTLYGARAESRSRSTDFCPRVPDNNQDTRNKFQASFLAIRRLYISRGHNFVGHHGAAAGRNPITEMAEIECVAGRGIRSDRFFDHRENYKGQITFFEFEVYALLCEVLNVFDKPPAVFRRNVITEGLDLNTLIGREFTIQRVRFLGTEECKPCYWMDQAFAPGAEELLRGRGGLRAVILSDGKLRAQAEATGQRFLEHAI